MLGNKRLSFQSPNAIDKGEEPPSRPQRSPRGDGRGNGSPNPTPTHNDNDNNPDLFPSSSSPTRSAVAVQERVARDERLFRDIRINIEQDNDEENPTGGARLRSHSTSSYEKEEENYVDEPLTSDTRLYATKLLEELSRDDDDDQQIKQENLGAVDTESRPLFWRRTSRRFLRSSTDLRNSTSEDNNEGKWQSSIYLVTNLLCGLILVGSTVAFFVVVSVAIAQRTKGRSPATLSSASTRLTATIDWLESHNISSRHDLQMEETPQYQAAVWLADQDLQQNDIPLFPVHNDEGDALHYEQFLQRYVLATLYYALDGEKWTRDLSFLTEDHACGWFHTEVGSGGLEYAIGVTCHSDSMTVRDIFMTQNNASGTIPSELKHLTRLELLSLRRNSISGTIPEHLQNIRSLKYLDLSQNALTGSIPSAIFKDLSELRVLGLEDNQLTGMFPSAIAKLTNLVTLDVERNELKGQITSILSNLTNLEYLYLGYNQFDETLDDSFLANLLNLRDLSLNNNRLQGQLPRSLLAHPSLTFLDISDNFITDTLPEVFVGSSKLQYLDLGTNYLSGTIPLTIHFFNNLQYLDLSSNGMNGAIPASLGNMKNLTHLSLSDNAFAPGPVPLSLFALQSLQELSLENVGLTGTIPTWFGLMSNTLAFLNMGFNELSGSVPDELWDLPLSVLLLGNNLLNVTLSPNLLGGSNSESFLEALTLDNNVAISGNITCTSAPFLRTFSYACDSVDCTGNCCHLECCSHHTNDTSRSHINDAPTSDQCFESLVGTFLQMREVDTSFIYHSKRTIDSFSPTIILRD